MKISEINEKRGREENFEKGKKLFIKKNQEKEQKFRIEIKIKTKNQKYYRIKLQKTLKK